jgi:hypothetical protein
MGELMVNRTVQDPGNFYRAITEFYNEDGDGHESPTKRLIE